VLDPDIPTGEALALLSQRDDHTAGLDRRRFLRLIGMGLGAGVTSAVAGAPLLSRLMPGYDAAAWASGPIGPNDGVLVVIGMYGGNDGLNMVAPITDPNYATQRGSLALTPSTSLVIDPETGLHPNLTELKARWDLGQLAIVEGVGYPNPDLSHFASMAAWMSGRPGSVPTSGWLGRWLDGYLGGNRDLFAAASIGSSVPLTLVGAASRGTAVPSSQPTFGADTSNSQIRSSTAIRSMATANQGAWHAAISSAFVDALDVGKTLAPVIPSTGIASGAMAEPLEVAAHLINANMGFRIINIGWGDFDSHASEATMHASRMTELNDGVRRFYEVLGPEWANRVTFMTFSEFGRTSWVNAGGGTDHGTASAQLVFGANVKGGRYGQRASLANIARWQRLAHHVDLRSYYTSILDGWMGGGASTILGGTFENLGLFRAGPGQPLP
jgi:hypothetical protein